MDDWASLNIVTLQGDLLAAAKCKNPTWFKSLNFLFISTLDKTKLGTALRHINVCQFTIISQNLAKYRNLA